MSTARVTIALVATAACIGPALAGPLSPPAGAIMPTYKTLKEVEPRTAITFENLDGDTDSVHLIDQPGSYYLTSNLYVPGGKHGIKITASNVTVDLMGFTIIDLGGAAGPAHSGIIAAVGVGGPVADLSIVNGFVSGCTRGVNIVSADASRVENVTCSGQAAEAFFIGASSLASECVARGAQTGFFVGDGSLISACTAVGNTQDGVRLAFRVSARDIVSRGNADDGFEAGEQCSFIACRAEGNGANGFNFAGDGSAATDCAANGSTASGFVLGNRGTARNCTASDNEGFYGFLAGAFCTIDQCSANASPTCFSLGSHSRITNSTAIGLIGGVIASGSGIEATDDGVVIRGNFVLDSVDGIFLASGADYCRVVGNHINIGGAGVHIRDFGTGNDVATLSLTADAASPHANFAE